MQPANLPRNSIKGRSTKQTELTVYFMAASGAEDAAATGLAGAYTREQVLQHGVAQSFNGVLLVDEVLHAVVIYQ